MTIYGKKLPCGLRPLIVVAAALLLFPFRNNAQSPSSQTGEEDVTELQEVVVKAKRQRYQKRGNPAYELMQEVRRSIQDTDPRTKPDYNFDFYEKIVLGMNDMTVDSTRNNVGFFNAYADTAVNTGKPVILLSIREKFGTEAYTLKPERHKTLVRARRNAGIDESFEQENINKMLEDVLRNIDIYANDIVLMQQRFVSPLGRIAGDYYHYSINDTVTFRDDPRKFIELVFAPANAESFGFNGRFYVADDSTRFIKKVSMRVPRAINLNYIDNIFINQEFTQDADGMRHKTLDDMSVELRILPGTPAFYGRRSSYATNFSDTPRDDMKEFLDNLADNIELDESRMSLGQQTWDRARIVPLSQAEFNLKGLHEEMKKRPLLYWGEKILAVLSRGYIGTGWRGFPSKFDFGPIGSFISYNSLEGLKLRVGGMTTAALSPHVFGRAFVAYGFRDHKWKYMGEAEYSFNRKKLHSREFPVNSFRFTHKYDVDMIGQYNQFNTSEDILMSFKRTRSDLATYERLSKLEYTYEFANHFSIVAGLKHRIQFATDYVRFINGAGSSRPHYSQSSVFITLRYAPGEVFYQGRTSRAPINKDAPVIQLTHEYGPRNVCGSLFTINTTELSVEKRLWFSSFGYADITLRGGKIWSRVQFPALLWPIANTSYTMQANTFSLMNPMEFANDWYGSLDITYYLNGLILNRIPLVKKAKLREIITFKLLEGGLTKKNNPEYNPDLFRFPYGSGTHVLGKMPYMEIGVGLDNILTFLRVDYVWRLSYRYLPGIDRAGLRVSLHFTF